MEGLDEIVSASARGSNAIDAWVKANPARITAALADAVHAEAVNRFTGTTDRADGTPLAFAAMRLYLMLGLQEKAMRAAFDYLQGVYMGASTVPPYQHAYEGARQMGGNARAASLGDLAFSCFVLAGDAAFCAAEIADPAAWVLRSLESLREAALDTAVALTPAMLRRYANVAPDLFRMAANVTWGADQNTAEALLVSLAADTERLLPADYTLPSDVETTGLIARRLAELSDEYGNPAVGAARRAFADRLSA